MRLGMSGAFLPSKMDEFSAETAKRIKDLRFSGCFTRFTDDPFELQPAKAHRVRDILADHGLSLYQSIVRRPPLHHPDESVRKESVKTLAAVLRMNKELGARESHTAPGSLNPKGAWTPHPYNWTEQAKDQLIKSLRELAPVAEDCGVYVGMEGHVIVTLNSAQTMADVLNAVGSKWIRCAWDAVNWITLDTIYDTTTAVQRMGDALGTLPVSAHAKDVVIEDRLVTHISEVPAGLGLLDYDVFMTRLEAIDPDLPLVVEHCTADELPRIGDFLHSKAADLGITIRE
jgi:sugar phosphate isomerase/epimerase